MKIWKKQILIVILICWRAFAGYAYPQQEKLSDADKSLVESNLSFAISFIKSYPTRAQMHVDSALAKSIRYHLPMLEAESRILLGDLYANSGDLTNGLKQYEQSELLFQQENSQDGLALCMQKTAEIYLRLKNYKESKAYAIKSYDLYQELNNPSGIVSSCNLLAEIHLLSLNEKKAIFFIEKALMLAIQHNNKEGITKAKQSKSIYLARKNLEKEALQELTEAFEIAIKDEDKHNQALTYNNYGLLYKDIKRYSEALKCLQKGQALAEKLDNKDLLEHNYRLQAEIYALQKKFADAYKFQLAYSNIKDSIITKAHFLEFAEYVKKNETQKVESLTEALKKSTILRKNITTESNVLRSIFFITLIVFVVIGIVVASAYKIKRNASLRLEALVKERTASLTEEVNKHIHTTNKLKEAIRKAEESNRLKSMFLSNLSHEIRTPMNSIAGFTQILEQQELSEQEKREYYSCINKNVQYLLEILSNMVEISKIRSGEVDHKPDSCFINPMIEHLFEVFIEKQQQLKKQNIHFKMQLSLPDSEAVIVADKTKLENVLEKLLDNAFKFTEKGKIQFGYHFLQESNEVCMFVSDTGIGILAENMQTIFDDFAQHNTELTALSPGTGLGLPIVKAYVEAMGSVISVKSNIGEGSSFQFTLPLQSKKN